MSDTDEKVFFEIENIQEAIVIMSGKFVFSREIKNMRVEDLLIMLIQNNTTLVLNHINHKI